MITPIQQALLERLQKLDILDAEEAFYYNRLSEDGYVNKVVSFFPKNFPSL